MHNKIALSLLAALAAGSVACTRKPADHTPQAPEIQVAEAVTDSLTLYKTYPGTLNANSTVNVVGRVNGTLLSSNFKGGDLVHKGQVLFTIEDRTYRDAVQQAQAQLASAKSANEYATKQYAAMKKALESDAVSQMEVAQAKNSMESSQAAIKSAEAALRTATTNLGYCTVTAPVTGHISSRNVDPGAYIGGEGAPVNLATIYADDEVHATFFIEDDSFMRMHSTQSNREGIDYSAIPLLFGEELPHSYTADLNYMAPEVNPSTGTIKIEANVANPYNELRAGMYVSVKLPWKTDPAAVLVKDASLSTDQLGKYLYTVNDSNKVVYTPVKVGDLYQDTLRIITDGIKPGTKYVTKAMLKVRPGMTVNPVLTR
ncbi:MAG: efflux RND transporter periplasmic adaptor subunit [Paramuribaculum sp.]|nr:efflux RND transporter periplasmic adaptor subunit [Paramuribaculum sp.]